MKKYGGIVLFAAVFLIAAMGFYDGHAKKTLPYIMVRVMLMIGRMAIFTMWAIMVRLNCR